jgi:hypothetical protein
MRCPVWEAGDGLQRMEEVFSRSDYFIDGVIIDLDFKG